LLTLAGFAVAVELALVDIAGGHELVTGTEPGVGALGRSLEHHHLAELRVEPGERTVGLLAPLLDTDPGAEPGDVARAVRTPGWGGDEAVEAQLGGDRHRRLLTSRAAAVGDRAQESGRRGAPARRGTSTRLFRTPLGR